MFDMITRGLSDVKRWGIVRTIRSQSVAEHQYFVGVWTPQLLRFVNVEDPALILQALEYALHHDDPEIVSGDVPTPLKKRLPPGLLDEATSFRIPPLKTPPEFILKAVKALDYLEALAFLYEEQAIGNHRLLRLINLLHTKFMKACDDFQDAASRSPDCVRFNPIDKQWVYKNLKKALDAVRNDQVDPFELYEGPVEAMAAKEDVQEFKVG